MIPTDILIWQQRLAIIRNHLDDDWQRTSALLYKVQTGQPLNQDNLDYIKQLNQWYQGRENKIKSANQSQNCQERLNQERKELDKDWQRYLALVGKSKKQEPFNQEDKNFIMPYLLMLPPLRPRYHEWLSRAQELKAQSEWDEKWSVMANLVEKAGKDQPLSRQDLKYLKWWHSQYPNR